MVCPERAHGQWCNEDEIRAWNRGAYLVLALDVRPEPSPGVTIGAEWALYRPAGTHRGVEAPVVTDVLVDVTELAGADKELPFARWHVVLEERNPGAPLKTIWEWTLDDNLSTGPLRGGRGLSIS